LYNFVNLIGKQFSSTLGARLRCYHWSIEKALTEPVKGAGKGGTA